MTRRGIPVVWPAVILAIASGLAAQEGPVGQDVAAASEADRAAQVDRVELADGSVVVGQIDSMVDGTLTIATAFGGKVSIEWKQVKVIRSAARHRFVLQDDSAIVGSSRPDDRGRLVLSGSGGGVEGSYAVVLDRVVAINPPAVRHVTYRGSVNLGVNVQDGNTQTKNGNLNADFEARSKRQRLTAGTAYNYSEQGGGITARNAKGRIKYDFFATDRLFVYSAVLLEADRFQDLNLRTAVSGGPGYQLIQAGDLEGDSLSKLEVYGEIGLSFFDEDFRVAVDNRYMAARWSVVANWPLSDMVSLFHRQEGYPGLENVRDFYITSEQGVRFQVWENFVATMQLNYRWDNTPSPGFNRGDTQYLATLGYSFDL